MGNILAFLSKYHRFFLFFLLELFSLYLVVSYNNNPNKAVSAWGTEFSGSVNRFYNDVNYYFHLKQVNDSLLQENTRLHNQVSTSFYADTAKDFIKRDTVLMQKYVFTPAKVVNNSVSSRNNYLTLDIGGSSGIDRGMGVITTAGVVGIVRDVSPNFSSVYSILHKDFTVSAEIAELGEIGSVLWPGEDARYVSMTNVPSHIDLKKGMKVVTSPFSAIFPQGTTIGHIDEFEVKSGDANYTVRVKLAANLRNVRQVYVIKNIMKEEQEAVEEIPEEEQE